MITQYCSCDFIICSSCKHKPFDLKQQINEKHNQIQQLTVKVGQLEQSNNQKAVDITSKAQQIQQLTTKVGQLEQSNNQKAVDITSKAQQIQQLTAKVGQLEQSNNQRAVEITSKAQQIQQLTTKVGQLEQSNNQKAVEITLKAQQIQQLTVKVEQLEQSNNQKVTEITTKAQQIAGKDQQIQALNLKISELEKRLSQITFESQQKCDKMKEVQDSSDQQIQGLKGKLQEKEEQKNDREVEALSPPSLSISMESLLSLNDPQTGWTIKSPDPIKLQDIKNKKMIIVSVLGMYDVGKSWFCNQFSGKNQNSSGYGKTTGSLNCIFPEEKEHLIGLIDTPGSHEAIRVTDPHLREMIETVNSNKIPETAHEKNLWHYKQLKNDAKIIQDLKERFIGEISDIVLLLCNKLSDKEQEVLYRVIKNHKEVLKERSQEAQRQYSSGRETLLFIIHNYKNLNEISQVEEQIKKDLFKSFQIEEVPMFGEKRSGFDGCNQTMYKDQFGVFHLILACCNSPAGKKYNPTTFDYLKNKVLTMSNRTSTDVTKMFLDFCNKNLPKILQQPDLKLIYNPDQSAIFRDPNSKNVVLDNIQYDEFGNYFFSSAFEPRYSIVRKDFDNQSQKEIMIEVELLDSEFKAKSIRVDGHYYLEIIGEKKVEIENVLGKGVEAVNNNRELGKFHIKIPLSKETLVKSRKEPESGIPQVGIMRYFFTFGLESGSEL